MRSSETLARPAPREAARCQPTKILIVDDHRFFSFCLQSLIDRDSNFTVCGVASDPVGLFERIDHFKPDLLMLDLSVGKSGGFDLACEIRRKGISIPILFISASDALSQRQLRAVNRAAFLPKGSKPDHLLSRIRGMLPRPNPEPVFSFGLESAS